MLDRAALRKAAAHLRAADPVLGGIVDAVGPCRMVRHAGGSGFWYLARAILRQQISGHAARAIDDRLHARFGPVLKPEHFLAASDEELRSLGLSRQKAGYLRDLSAHARNGLPFARLTRLADERVIETLTRVKGVGRWTAEMYLMFRLGRPDVLPVDDYGIRKAMQLAYGWRSLPKPDRMRRTAEAWRPFRSAACWYLWRSLELGRETP
jgi:3-methyladenine DNA glycosylase/8-oxoguanine DNA glycosylase